MTGTYSGTDNEHRTNRHAVQAHEHSATNDGALSNEQSASVLPAASRLLSASSIETSSNAPMRAGAMQSMQRAYGNRSVQRYIQRSVASVQRVPTETINMEETYVPAPRRRGPDMDFTNDPEALTGIRPPDMDFTNDPEALAASPVAAPAPSSASVPRQGQEATPNTYAGLSGTDLRAVRDTAGQVSDPLGLAGSLIQEADHASAVRLATSLNSVEEGAGAVAHLANGASPLSGLTRGLGGLTSGVGLVTGVATAMDPRQAVTGRVLGGAGALSSGIGLAGLGTSALSATGSLAAVGTGGTLLGAGLAGVTIGDLLTRGGESIEERVTGRPVQHYGLGDVTASDWAQTGDYIMNGAFGQGGLNSVGRGIAGGARRTMNWMRGLL